MLINADYSALTEEIKRRHESPKCKVGEKSELLSTRIFLAKVTPIIGQEKYLILILC